MTNAELIAKIKAEIERLIVKHELEYTTAGYVMNELLSFLSTLESEKPMNQKGLEREIERCLWKLSDDPSNEELRMFASHFAEWGAEHLANAHKTSPNDLEETAVDIADALLSKPKDYALSAKADYWNGAHDGIIAGAKWQKEQMMEEAVEGVLVDNVDGTQEICLHGNRYGEKVRIIIVKEDEK